MSLKKEVFANRVTCTPEGGFHVTETTVVTDDGQEVARSSAGRVIEALDDVSSEEGWVKNMANAFYTPEMKRDAQAVADAKAKAQAEAEEAKKAAEKATAAAVAASEKAQAARQKTQGI